MWFDASKDFVLVAIAAIAFFMATTQSTTGTISLSSLILGTSFFPIILVLYKTASFKRGFQGLYARARALLMILMFIPPWIISSMIIIFNPTLESLTSFFSARFSYLILLMQAFSLIASYFVSNRLVKSILKKTRIEKRVAEYVLEYDWRPDFMYIYTVSIVTILQPFIVHLSYQELWFVSDYLFLQASLFIIIIGIIGVAFVYIEPETYNLHDNHDVVKATVVISALISLVSFVLSIIILIPALWKLKKRSDRVGNVDYRLSIDSTIESGPGMSKADEYLEIFEEYPILFIILLIISIVALIPLALYVLEFTNLLTMYLCMVVILILYLLCFYVIERINKSKKNQKSI